MNSKTEKLLKAREELYTEIYRVADLVYEIREDGSRCFDDSDTIELCDGDIEISWEESSCGCCGPDYYCISFPQDYLFNDNWEADLRNQIDTEKKEKEARALKEREEQAALKLERERKSYLKLKEQFEQE